MVGGLDATVHSALKLDGRRMENRQRKTCQNQRSQQELEAFGVRVISQYAVLGPYDFATIVEAPDNKTIGKVSIELGSRGTVKIMSMAAVPIEEFIASMKKR